MSDEHAQPAAIAAIADGQSTTSAKPISQAKPSAFRNGKGGFAGRPMRRRVASTKATVVSPEARRLAEERKQQQIDDFLATGKVTRYEPKWADGAVPMNLFGNAG